MMGGGLKKKALKLGGDGGGGRGGGGGGTVLVTNIRPVRGRIEGLMTANLKSAVEEAEREGRMYSLPDDPRLVRPKQRSRVRAFRYQFREEDLGREWLVFEGGPPHSTAAVVSAESLLIGHCLGRDCTVRFRQSIPFGRSSDWTQRMRLSEVESHISSGHWQAPKGSSDQAGDQIANLRSKAVNRRVTK